MRTDEQRRPKGLLWAVGLCLAVASVNPSVAVSEPLGRAKLTGRLIPVTGETARSVDLVVPFARGSADLTVAARRQLDELGAALSGEALREFDVGVYGHTDASGPAAYNLALSEKRAVAAVAYLVEHFALDHERFRHEGRGEEHLLEGVSPDSPRHRRVEIVVFSPEYGHAGKADADGTDAGKMGQPDAGEQGKGVTGLQAIQ